MIHRKALILPAALILASLILSLAGCGSEPNGTATAVPATQTVAAPKALPANTTTQESTSTKVVAPEPSPAVTVLPTGESIATEEPIQAEATLTEEVPTDEAVSEEPTAAPVPPDEWTTEDETAETLPTADSALTPRLTPGPTSVPITIGAAQTAGAYKITVNSSRRAPNGEYESQPGMEYLLINLTVENVGTGMRTINHIPDFDFQDKNAQSYRWSLSPDTSYLDGSIAPGAKLTGDLAYEVPIGAKGFLLYFKSNWQPDGKISFDIDQ